jgi:hypothetical protein
MQKNNLVRYLAIFDAHCGYEFNEESDYDKSIPRFVKSHDEILLRKIYKFAKGWKPDYVIWGGDQINLSCISRWTEKKPRMIEGRTIREDFQFYTELCEPINKLSSVKEIVWIEGNHEERLRELVNKHPQLDGVAMVYNLLELTDGGRSLQDYTFVPTGRLWKPEGSKVSFTHGHIVLGGSGNQAKKLTDAYHRSVRAGHLHSYMAWTERVAADSDDYHTGIVVPPACKPNLPYAKNKPSSNQQGFLIGEYDSVTGKFWDQVILSVNGEFVINGKRY